jgi:phosphoglycerate dehydrogenase-like enzyme
MLDQRLAGKHTDVVSLHVPLLPSTYHIMNKPRCAF